MVLQLHHDIWVKNGQNSGQFIVTPNHNDYCDVVITSWWCFNILGYDINWFTILITILWQLLQ